MPNELAEIILRLAAGYPVGQGAVSIPVEISANMTERQLDLFIVAMNKKEPELPDEPDPREYHRDWAKQNKIPKWHEAEMWERKSAGRSE